MLPTDLEGMFEMDSNPNVHKYLGRNPVKTKEDSRKIIESIRQQYVEKGIGRWVMEDKKTGKFIGWTGFKINEEPLNGQVNLLDIGYRMLESEWGKGYATESSFACMDYLCERGDHPIIYGAAVVGNDASIKILHEKLGMRYVDSFFWDDDECYFYEITREEWLERRKKQ